MDAPSETYWSSGDHPAPVAEENPLDGGFHLVPSGLTRHSGFSPQDQGKSFGAGKNY
jgi:hypothetical protein